jgi:hypothetical protein
MIRRDIPLFNIIKRVTLYRGTLYRGFTVSISPIHALHSLTFLLHIRICSLSVNGVEIDEFILFTSATGGGENYWAARAAGPEFKFDPEGNRV